MAELDRLVDSLLLPGFAGPALPEWTAEALGNGLAGICLYGANLPPEGSVAGAVAGIAAAARAAAPDALVALDEEGGDVTRLDYRTGSRYPGNLALGVADDEALTERVATAIGGDLRRAGVTVDFAPSVDVNSDPRNPVIGVRSFGGDPSLVARHGAAFVRGLRAAGVAATAKHFPGHGATTVDSHLGLPVIDADEPTFRRRDLPPFAAAVDAGVDLVMTSHVVFSALDDRPATLSRRLLVDLLRGELGFTGVVVTDALDMAGVRAAHGIPRAAALSLTAGADLLLVGAEDGERHCADIRREVAAHVRDGRLPESRLVEAADRVGALRARLAATEDDAPAPDEEAGREAARQALRIRAAGPLPGPAVVAELRGEANQAVGAAGWSLAGALSAHGLLAVQAHGAVDEVLACAAGRPLVIAVRDAYRRPELAARLRELTAARPDAVTVALGMPDDLGLVPGPAIATHGAALVCTQAAADVLAGA